MKNPPRYAAIQFGDPVEQTEVVLTQNRPTALCLLVVQTRTAFVGTPCRDAMHKPNEGNVLAVFKKNGNGSKWNLAHSMA